MSKLIAATLCECADPQCPVCHGKCLTPAIEVLYRVDMDDNSGTAFCEGCCADAMESALFTDSIEDTLDDSE